MQTTTPVTVSDQVAAARDEFTLTQTNPGKYFSRISAIDDEPYLSKEKMAFYVFPRRPFPYKVGLILLMSSLMFYLIGFSSPYWYKTTVGAFYVHGGLWQNCVQMLYFRICSSFYKGSMTPDWFYIAQALISLGLVCLVLSIIYGIVVNWVQRQPKHTRILEFLASLASALGVAGTVLFIVKAETDSKGLTVFFSGGRAYGVLKKHTVDWALGLNLAASIVCLIATVIIAIHNSSIPPPDPEPAGIGYVDPDTGMVYPVVDVTGQEVYYINQTQMMGNFQPVVAPCQPPPYETSVGTSHYSAMTSTQYSAPAYTQFSTPMK